MNPVEMLLALIKDAIPTAKTSVHRPRAAHGSWWVDASTGDHSVRIEWSPRRGFGVSAGTPGDETYGEGHDETFESSAAAAARIVELLQTRTHTQPPHGVLLGDLRAMVGLTQEQLAQRLGVQQAAVSRLERRDDITLSSLQRFVTALGAELEINVRTSTGERVRLFNGETAKTQRVACNHITFSETSRQTNDANFSISELLRRDLNTMQALIEQRWSVCNTTITFDESAPLALANALSNTITLNPYQARRLLETLDTADLDAVSDEPSRSRAVLIFLAAHEYGHLISDTIRFCGHSFGSTPADELRSDALAGWVFGRMHLDAQFGELTARSLGCLRFPCSHPTPEERSLSFLIGHVSARSELAIPAMNLLVLRAADLERARRFYELLGLHFRAEQHGSGPKHYSSDVNGSILELYPCSERASAVRLGMRVPTPANAIDDLVANGFATKRPKLHERASGPAVYIVHDPDGNAVEVEAR